MRLTIPQGTLRLAARGSGRYGAGEVKAPWAVFDGLIGRCESVGLRIMRHYPGSSFDLTIF
jgi:hypothetical protein